VTSDYVAALENIVWLKMLLQERRNSGRPTTDLLVDLQHATDELAECIKRELSERLN
jgi:hypothetical protein